MSHALFRAMAPQIMRDIMRDLDAHVHGAAAAVGNFGHETRGLELRLEGGKKTYDTTGFGWAQWTGSRRRDFDRWARANGFGDVADDPAGCPDDRYHAACYRFFIHEITNTWEKRALPNLRMAWSQPGRSEEQDVAERTLRFMREYERPGVPHQDRRIEMAKIALAEYRASAAEPAAPVTPSQPSPARKEDPMSSVVPSDWMPAAKMSRIIVHWTAGGHKASSTDRNHYHVLIEGDGNVVRGVKSIKDNESTSDGIYAAHTLSCNTNSIGISMCGMMGAIENPFQPGPAPLTKVQWDKMTKVAAALAQRYGIPVKSTTILTHAEVQGNLGIPQRGKWDITRLAFDPSVIGAKACGDRMRNEIRAAIGAPAPVVPKGTGTAATGTVIVGGGVAAAKQAGFDWGTIIPIALIAIAAVVAAFFIVRSKRRK